jgi:hypothetical protein
VQLVIRLKFQQDQTTHVSLRPVKAMMRGTNLLIGTICLACLFYAWESTTWLWGAAAASLNLWLAWKPLGNWR